MKLRPGAVALTILVALTIAAIGCRSSTNESRPKPASAPPTTAGGARDWSRYPAIVERTTSVPVLVLGDVHGGYDRLVTLLVANGVAQRDDSVTVGYSWAAGDRLLVCTGDMIDKGDESAKVLDLMMALQGQAPSTGGEVIVTLGNHEVEFMANPANDKATEFVAELHRLGIDPASIANGTDPRGQWIRNLPLAARVNEWFFAHAGNTSGETIAELSESFRKAVDANKWGAKFLVDDDSILESRMWWTSKKDLDENLEALGVRHIVFGHDPSAFDEKGVIGERKDGKVFLEDVGMSPAIDYSTGALLLLERTPSGVVATSLDAQGARREVWREP